MIARSLRLGPKAAKLFRSSSCFSCLRGNATTYSRLKGSARAFALRGLAGAGLAAVSALIGCRPATPDPGPAEVAPLTRQIPTSEAAEPSGIPPPSDTEPDEPEVVPSRAPAPSVRAIIRLQIKPARFLNVELSPDGSLEGCVTNFAEACRRTRRIEPSTMALADLNVRWRRFQSHLELEGRVCHMGKAPPGKRSFELSWDEHTYRGEIPERWMRGSKGHTPICLDGVSVAEWFIGSFPLEQD